MITPVAGLDVEFPDDLSQPLAIAMVIKGLDADGQISYWVTSTDGLMNVEIIGMMTWGAEVALHADGD